VFLLNVCVEYVTRLQACDYIQLDRERQKRTKQTERISHFSSILSFSVTMREGDSLTSLATDVFVEMNQYDQRMFDLS
jgi:hypothetical protein